MRAYYYGWHTYDIRYKGLLVTTYLSCASIPPFLSPLQVLRGPFSREHIKVSMVAPRLRIDLDELVQLSHYVHEDDDIYHKEDDFETEKGSWRVQR